ncbi:disease resistance protein RPM1-like [Pistacia vera]|uniref:disease resistance protein RPM1-like n=1 Tax=Pistacia vera TaxID=55513 RepID=UPI00126359B3|nr:disease resistance protein RPM1-like [Pistacia vera]
MTEVAVEFAIEILSSLIVQEVKLLGNARPKLKKKEEIMKVSKHGDEGSSSGTGGVIPHDSRVGSIFIEELKIVGIESSKHKLIDLLVNGKSNLSVIAMVGEGGLGKTTLAGKIYNNDVVKKHFDCRTWITIGKEYVKKDLLKTIKQEVHHQTGYPSVEIEDTEETNLMTALRTLLKDKCYMVVFDDVWKDDFWEDVNYALLDNKKGSRVMLTTRYMTIAHSVPFVNVHELEHLPSNKAWELFCRKAFGFNMSCPTELEKLSHEILAKCGGLPLAIVAVGGILSNKNKVVSEWQKLLGGLGSKLGSDPHLRSCNRVLSEGYYDLPHHLKSCLSYFALFPQGFEIKFGKLIRLWIVEGFVQYSKHYSLEQVAEDYLTELIDRSLVQVSRRKVSGRARTCKVHDLMHEILLNKTKGLGFYRDLSGENLSHKTRRISVNRGTDVALERIKDSKIHSICLFNVDKLPRSFMSTVFASFKFLKILDFEDCPVEHLPDGVGKLFHLHYLSLRRTNIKELPKSIGMLINLETLDLKFSFVAELPVEIKNLKKLRCLIVYHRYGFITKIHKGLGVLTNLNSLQVVEANSKVLEELKQLRLLRRLDIQLENRFLKNLFLIVKTMENLERLAITSKFEEEILNISCVASPPECLRSLFLKGNIKKLPFWIFELKKLINIELFYTGTTDDDPISALQGLPNLLRLIINMRYCDEKLHLKEGWFPKLEALYLENFGGLKWMMIDKGFNA